MVIKNWEAWRGRDGERGDGGGTRRCKGPSGALTTLHLASSPSEAGHLQDSPGLLPLGPGAQPFFLLGWGPLPRALSLLWLAGGPCCQHLFFFIFIFLLPTLFPLSAATSRTLFCTCLLVAAMATVTDK